MKKLITKFFGRRAKIRKKATRVEHPFFQGVYDAYILGNSTTY